MRFRNGHATSEAAHLPSMANELFSVHYTLTSPVDFCKATLGEGVSSESAPAVKMAPAAKKKNATPAPIATDVPIGASIMKWITNEVIVPIKTPTAMALAQPPGMQRQKRHISGGYSGRSETDFQRYSARFSPKLFRRFLQRTVESAEERRGGEKGGAKGGRVTCIGRSAC